MHKVVNVIVILFAVIATAIYFVDNIYPLEFMPQVIRDASLFDLLAPPIGALIISMLYKMNRTAEQRQTLETRKDFASYNASRLGIQAVYIADTQASSEGEGEIKEKFHRIQWVSTGRASALEMPSICGNEQAAKLVEAMAQQAVKTPGCTILHPKTVAEALALSNLEEWHCSNRQSHSGEMQEFVLVPCCEPGGRKTKTTILEIPPSLLLLYLQKRSIHEAFTTKRSHQFNRSITLDEIAQLVFVMNTQMPDWENFQGGLVYSVRDLPFNPSKDEFKDWWNKEWVISPNQPLSEDEIREKSIKLMLALQNHEARTYTNAHQVVQHPEFASTLKTARAATERIKSDPTISILRI